MKEGRREGGKEGRREGGKEGRREGGKEGRREGGKREGGKEGRREGGKEGRREGGKEGRREGREGSREGRSARARVVLLRLRQSHSVSVVSVFGARGRCESRTAESDLARAVPEGRLTSALSRTKTPRLCVATQSRSVKTRLCPQMAAPCSQPVRSIALYPHRTEFVGSSHATRRCPHVRSSPLVQKVT